MTKPRFLTESEIAIAREMHAQGIGRAPICKHLKCGSRVLSRSLREIAWPTAPKPRNKFTPSRDPVTDYPIGCVPKGHPNYDADQQMRLAKLAAGYRLVEIDGKIEWRLVARPVPTAVGGWRRSSMAWD